MGAEDMIVREGESKRITISSADIDEDSMIVRSAFFDGNKDSVIIEFD